MTRNARSLPAFDKPPVVETAVGVEFAPLQRWSIPYYGLFWHHIKDKYPVTRTIFPPPKAPDESSLVSRSEFPFFPIRCQFLQEDSTQLIQVQNDRFYYNWQRTDQRDDYPHYENLRPLFAREWERFQQFTESEALGLPRVHTCEITYVNHIERGSGWDTLSDLSEVIQAWSGMPGSERLSNLGAVALDLVYPTPTQDGALRIQLHHVIRQADGKEALQLLLTTRSSPASSHVDDVLDSLDIGHDLIVQSFVDFTTPHMHRLWQRREAQ